MAVEETLIWLPQRYTGARSWTLLDAAGDPATLTGERTKLRLLRTDVVGATEWELDLVTSQDNPGKVTFTFTQEHWSQQEGELGPLLSPLVGATYALWFVDYQPKVFIPEQNRWDYPAPIVYPEDRPGILTISRTIGSLHH